ncbi:MAG TPA: site-2 protease family protein [Candidatus Moranbacteria bacterium]|nr:site-2 protease family protein [Candidatus Moranbacteria bacterium]
MDINTVVIIAFYLVILLYSVILHEVAHGLAALRLGDRTAQLAGRLTLNPRSHIDPLGSIILPLGMLILTGFRFAFGWAKPVPYNPFNLRGGTAAEVAVALAGPATNFALAAVATAVAKSLSLTASLKMGILSGVMSADWGAVAELIAGSLGAILYLFCVIAIFWNVLLGVFNLLPFPPLDGSKLLYALVPISDKTKFVLEQYGFFILLGLILLFPGPLSALLQIVWGLFFALSI